MAAGFHEEPRQAEKPPRAQPITDPPGAVSISVRESAPQRQAPRANFFSLVGSAASPATRLSAGPRACERGLQPASTARVGGRTDRTRSAQSRGLAPTLAVLPRPDRFGLMPLRAIDRGAEIRGKNGLPALSLQLQLRIRARNTDLSPYNSTETPAPGRGDRA